MFEDFMLQKRMRRFKRDIAVLKKDGITVKLLIGTEYVRAYEKIWEILKNEDSSKRISLDICFVSDEFVSFMYKTDDKCIGLNYSVSSGYFERESVILKHVGVKKKTVDAILKRNLIKPVKLFSRIFLFSGGIGVICDVGGDRLIKIRL